MRVLIEVKSGKQAGRRIALRSGENVQIGRGLDVEVAFPDDSFMSGVHCIVQCGVKICTISDRDSKNGVVVNGAKIRSVALKDGDEILVGGTYFSVQMREDRVERGLDEAALAGRSLVNVLREEFQPLYAILDAALDNTIPAMLRSSGAEYQSLYEGARGEELAEVAPHLVRLPADSLLLKILESEGYAKNWAVFLTCDQPLKELRRHLRRFLTVKLPDGKKAFFRFYDPRVLRVFLPTCDERDAVDFFGPVNNYLMEDEEPNKFLRFWLEKQGVAKAELTLTAAVAAGVR